MTTGVLVSRVGTTVWNLGKSKRDMEYSCPTYIRVSAYTDGTSRWTVELWRSRKTFGELPIQKLSATTSTWVLQHIVLVSVCVAIVRPVSPTHSRTGFNYWR